MPNGDEVADRARPGQLTDLLLRTLHILAAALGVAAVAHLARYVLLSINRSTPVPGWTDTLTAGLVIFAGVFALAVFVYTTVVFVRWIRELRTDAYRRHDQRDPRRWWQVALLAGVPLVNVVGAGWLLHEVVSRRDDLDNDLTRERLTRIWVAWATVNAFALLAVVTRVVARLSGSIQTGANGLLAVTVSAAVSAAFAWWLAGRFRTIFGASREGSVPTRRWVAVA